MQVLLTTVCSLLAAICGAFIVHWLTRSREHRTWVRDCRMKEWQELLDSLTHAYMALLTDTRVIQQRHVRGRSNEMAGSPSRGGYHSLGTRIFIADDVETLDLRKRWAEYVTGYLDSRDKSGFQAEISSDSIIYC